MSKSETTKILENYIWDYTKRQGLFACFEVTIGWFGHERVDFMTYDTKGNWRCYEIKSSLADFKSKCNHTFVGHLNYYVMPKDVYDKVSGIIPDGIGVVVRYYGTVRKPKRRPLAVDEETLFKSMVRSLYREASDNIERKMQNDNDRYDR